MTEKHNNQNLLRKKTVFGEEIEIEDGCLIKMIKDGTFLASEDTEQLFKAQQDAIKASEGMAIGLEEAVLSPAIMKLI